jgi:hypothetical protein
MITDPIDVLENSDSSEVECCHACRELIEPGTDVDWNGWFWHADCVPSHVLFGLEQAAREDEAKHEW